MKFKAIHNPYEQLTDGIVIAAIHKEFGNEAVLESYEVVDFMKKGDNYASCVTSVKVNYSVDGAVKEQTYIVKLNNRNFPDAIITSMFRKLYLREPIALGPLSAAMNENLKQIRQPAIRAPKCLASCDEKGMEALLTEDLRPQGFVMFDKRKGMDMKHAKFVVEELGRFHASSVVYDEKLGREGTSLEELYPPINDPYFNDADSPSVDAICNMIRPQVQIGIDILKYIRESPEVNKWWETMKNFSGHFFVRNHDPFGKFSVLVHGDCWNNNMLFKYSEKGDPIDYRLVDFQIIRRGSPAADLRYFFYTSLLGDMRRNNTRVLLIHYYLSFAKILLLNNVPVPFTFQELEDEFTARMPYGFVSAMMALVVILVKPEDALDIEEFMDTKNHAALEKRNNFFEYVKTNSKSRTRFLDIFDEMIAARIFDRTKTIYNPYNLLTEELVENALKEDVGKQANMMAFEVKKFTNEGDNYASIVIGVNVYYSENECEKKKKTYVVKLHKHRKPGGFTEMYDELYQREIQVLTTIAKGMNEQLEKINQPPLKVPTVYAVCDEHKKEVFIAENLRIDGFRMFDRRKGLDSVHCFLVLKELGRFHASSLLYEDHLKCPIREKFDCFQNSWSKPGTAAVIMFESSVAHYLENAIALLSRLPKYKIIIKWLESLRGKMAEFHRHQFDPSKKKFNVLSHGDCWTNNILFKYDATGNPNDVRLLDFQGSCVTSVAKDLNYFMYTCIEGDTRSQFKNRFLIDYYLSFCEILLLADKPIPFTFKELKEEVRSLAYYGCIAGIILVGCLLGKSMDSLKFDEIPLTDFEKNVDFTKEFNQIISHDDIISNRFLPMFADLINDDAIPKINI